MISLEGYGPLELLEPVGAGGSLWRVASGGRTLLLKVPGDGPDSAEPFLARQSIVFTRQFSAIARSGEPASPLGPQERLQLEAERVHQSGGAWGHAVLWGGLVRGYEGEPYGLLLPHHEGRALSELSRGEQRRLLPRRMPWLWDALTAAPHGDLHGGNVLVGSADDLVLIDPGVLRFRYRENSGDSVSECTFTTNTFHYPVLPPYYRPGLPMAQVVGLSAHFALLRQGLSGVAQVGHLSFAGGPAPMLAGPLLAGPLAHTEPAAPDLMALGVLYYRALTGRHPLYDAQFVQPAWLGGRCIDAHRELDTGFEAALERLARPLVPPEELESSVRPAESALCRALLELRVSSRGELALLSRAAAASPP